MVARQVECLQGGQFGEEGEVTEVNLIQMKSLLVQSKSIRGALKRLSSVW